MSNSNSWESLLQPTSFLDLKHFLLLLERGKFEHQPEPDDETEGGVVSQVGEDVVEVVGVGGSCRRGNG